MLLNITFPALTSRIQPKRDRITCLNMDAAGTVCLFLAYAILYFTVDISDYRRQSFSTLIIRLNRSCFLRLSYLGLSALFSMLCFSFLFSLNRFHYQFLFFPLGKALASTFCLVMSGTNAGKTWGSGINWGQWSVQATLVLPFQCLLCAQQHCHCHDTSF